MHGSRGRHTLQPGGRYDSQGHVWWQGGHAWQPGGMRGSWGGDVRAIRRDTVNERVVRILLECILVHACYHILFIFTHYSCITQLRVKVFNGVSLN